MLYYLFFPFKDYLSFLNLFKYITFRASMAALTTLLFSLLFGKHIINWLKNYKIKENIRKEECPQLYSMQSHKQGTPTMGGVIIVSSVVISTILWADVFNKYVLMVIFVFLGLAIVGFTDDYIKIKHKRSKGLDMAAKFIGQLIIGLIFSVIVYFDKEVTTKVYFPFFKDLVFDIGIFFIPFVILVICGTSNAVNFTDGLDGLAMGCTIMTALTFSVLCYVSGHMKFSTYLFIPFIEHAGELTVFCAALVGACLGFLWFNCFPAEIFMGDVGSLALGGVIGAIAVLIKKEILLILVGGVFVAEAVSVILQIISFRVMGRRIFKMSPLHHHFQIQGIPESKIIIRFWIIAAILAIITLVTLKIR